MSKPNFLLRIDRERFVVGCSDFSDFGDLPRRSECGAIIFCRGGRAVVTIDLIQNEICENVVMLILPGAMFGVVDRSKDFRFDYCAFSRDMFEEAGFRLEPSFFQFLRDNPLSHPSPQMAHGVEIWFEIMRYTYEDRKNIFRDTIARNRLQNIFLESYDRARRNQSGLAADSSIRQLDLFNRFMSLVQERCLVEREVTFYADYLCISARYLAIITRQIAGQSPKDLIDKSVLTEIKVLLQSTHLSVQEIADRMHFPDQSYLSRYFKKHTGESPTSYRLKNR